MAEAQFIEKPKRWDIPFSQDLPNPEERRDMTEQDVSRLLSVEPFSGMNPDNFSKNLPLRGILKNDTRIRRYQPGDVIVRQGDYGNSAFLVLQGAVKVVLEGLDSKQIGRREAHTQNPLRSLLNVLTNPRAPEVRDARKYPAMQDRKAAAHEEGHAVLVQDVTNVMRVAPDVVRNPKNPDIGEGEVFGELAALGRIPRSATVVAAGSGVTELLEIRWQGLRDLRKFDEGLRQHVDERYRSLGLADALRASPLLNVLSESEMQQVTESAVFETFGQFDWFGSYQKLREKDVDPLSQEPVIAAEGHYPNGLIMIRAGFARMSREFGNGERTFSYMSKGDIYGLPELAYNARHNDSVPCTASLRAVGYVDIVRIPTRVFEAVILPKLPANLVPDPPKMGDELDARDTIQLEVTRGEMDTAMMEFLVENRFVNGTATMMIDLDRCTRCDDCVRACASGHTNNPRFIRHGKIRGHHMIANACMHCVDPVCMIGCPTGAIHRNLETGEVVINDITCIGCSTCANSCPYDNIRMVEVRDKSSDDAIMVDPARGKPIVKATKCDLCVDHHGGPACERACPHDALKRVNMHETDLLGKWLSRS